MIPIHKNPPPNSLSQYPHDPNASFDNMSSAIKNELRQSLLKEQGEICCYCMCRIKLDSSRIEHWECQSLTKKLGQSQKNYPDKTLDYDNMMLACSGNEGDAETHHCDIRKGDLPLTFNPSSPAHARRLKIRYLKNGTIESENAEFNVQLDEVLNLNEAMLKANWASVCGATIQTLNKIGGPKKDWTKAIIDKYIQKYKSWHNGQAEPYCGVAVYSLEKLCRRH